MRDPLGLLLTLPVESVAVRAVLASALSVLLVRLLLRTGVRSVGARVATALAPATALVVVLLLSSRDGLQLPLLMFPADAVDALAVPVTDGYLHFAPIAAPLLIGAWTAIAGLRIARRGLVHLRAHRTLRAAREASVPAPLTALAVQVAGTLKLPTPALAVVPTCPGGAYVIGVRRPVIVVGRDLATLLDPEELEGVLAHELAHVKRRDNLVATVLGVLRDLAFFVPGGGWAVAQLHRERERAADQLAVRATGRPGALASGLLWTIQAVPARGHTHQCAAFAPSDALVQRVRDLVDDRPAVSRLRRGSELVAVSGVTLAAVTLAVVVPAAVAGAERERDAVAVVWSAPAPSTVEPAAPAHEPRAFDVYRRTRLEVDGPAPVSLARLDGSSVDDRPSTWRACADPATCPDPQDAPGLGLVPRPVITVDDDLTESWLADPLFRTPTGSDTLPALYWLRRVS